MQNFKYDPDQWLDMDKGAVVPCPKNVHLRLAKPGTVHVDFGDGKRLVGYGTEFKVQLTQAAAITADQPFSIFVGVDTVAAQHGVPLTNFDKRPGLSPVERMVKSMMLEQTVKERLRRERREADREANERRVQAGLQEENPIEDDPAPGQEQPGEQGDGIPVEAPAASSVES